MAPQPAEDSPPRRHEETLMRLIAGPLELRPLHPIDVPAMRALLTDPALMKYALKDRALTHEEAENFLRDSFATADEAFGMHVVAIAASSNPIGFSGYRRCRLLEAEDVEFGWVLGADYHGQGYATRLGEALIHHALAILHLDRVLAACHPHNVASERVLRDKLHMQFVQEVPVHGTSRRRVYIVHRLPL